MKSHRGTSMACDFAKTLAAACAGATRLGLAALLGLLLGATAHAQAKLDDELTRALSAALAEGASVERVASSTGELTHISGALGDSSYPPWVDVLVPSNGAPDHVVYMLPGGGANFAMSYLTPLQTNLATFLCNQGALVVGITPPEDAVPTGLPSYAFMRNWGLAKHSADVRRVISNVQTLVDLPFDILGHSYGASIALDVATRQPDLRRLIVLDTYSLDPQSELRAQAERTYDAHVQLIDDGVFHDETYSQFKPGVLAAAAAPQLDSGTSRQPAGAAGNFTLEGLVYFSLINSAGLPGIHTSITSLPGDWLLQRGFLAGEYTVAPNPQDDQYAFSHTTIVTVRQAAALAGSGIIPVALERDIWAVTANNGSPKIRWNRIDAEVIWLNTELGYAHHTWGATRIRRGGNERVTVDVIDGYGHIDMLWGDNAQQDVWQRLQ